MTKNTIIATIVAVLTIVSTSFATIVPSIPAPSSGGSGGSSSPTTPPVNPRFESRTEMPGFQSYLSGSNNQAWYHEWASGEGHMHEAESTGYYNFKVSQGLMGNQYLPVQSGIEVVRWDNQGNFNIRADFKIISPEFLQADYLDTPSGGRNWNAFGNISMGHQTSWNWKTGEEFITADVTGGFNYNFQDTILLSVSDRVSEWQTWGEKGETPDGLRLTAWFNLQYTGENLDTFNNVIGLAPANYDAPLSMSTVPEPATMLLLGLGSIVLLRKRRK